MSKKLFLFVLGGVAISGVLLLIRDMVLGHRRETLHLYPASPVDFLREKNFGGFPVEIPEAEFDAWAV